MSWPRSLVLVRHAESEGNVLSPDDRAAYNVATYAYGLTELGKQQAVRTGKWLHATYPKGFDVRYVSYYKRTKDTMAIMCPGKIVYEDARLAEGQRGIYHAMNHAQIAERYPEELLRKDREGLYHYRPFGGENWPDIELRIHSFLGTLARDCAGLDVLIACHGHWLLMFQKLIHHYSIEETLARYKNGVAPNASVTVYENQKYTTDRNMKIREGLVLSQEYFVPPTT